MNSTRRLFERIARFAVVAVTLFLLFINSLLSFQHIMMHDHDMGSGGMNCHDTISCANPHSAVPIDCFSLCMSMSHTYQHTLLGAWALLLSFMMSSSMLLLYVFVCAAYLLYAHIDPHRLHRMQLRLLLYLRRMRPHLKLFQPIHNWYRTRTLAPLIYS